jgi:L-aspartate semialdehyde sulfurtransferase
MCANDRSVSEINRKILAGEARVHTEMELRDRMESGLDLAALDVDVVTMAFHSSMAKTAAMVVVPVTGRGVFTRAEKIYLNGVPGYPGPAPNERLGVVDTLVFADEGCDHAEDPHKAARLFTELLNNAEIQVECISVEGGTYKSSFLLQSLQYARMITYNTSIPLSRTNDGGDAIGANEHLGTIRVGSKVLLNKAPGIVIGCGTRGCSATLSLSAEMFEMDPGCLGEISGDLGPPIAHSVALAIPVVNAAVLQGVAGYLGRMQKSDAQGGFDESDESMAAYLKELVLNKAFLLNDSYDRPFCA